jgi:hypothetical protein
MSAAYLSSKPYGSSNPPFSTVDQPRRASSNSPAFSVPDGWEPGVLAKGYSSSMVSPVLGSSDVRGGRRGGLVLVFFPMTESLVLPIALASAVLPRSLVSVGLPITLGSAFSPKTLVFAFSGFLLLRMPGTRPTLDSA